MKIGEIRTALKPYRAWLGLDDLWKEFEIRRAKKGDDLPDEDEANVSWQIDHRKVTIVLSRKADLRAAVHELWHVRLEGHLEDPLPRNAHYEATIWHLTDALIKTVDSLTGFMEETDVD